MAQHHRHAGLGADKRPVQVNGHDLPPIVQRRVAQRLEDGNARVVHQRVDAAKVCRNVVHRCLHLVGVTHITGQGDQTLGLREGIHGLVQFVCRNVQRRHPVTVH